MLLVLHTRWSVFVFVCCFNKSHQVFFCLFVCRLLLLLNFLCHKKLKTKTKFTSVCAISIRNKWCYSRLKFVIRAYLTSLTAVLWRVLPSDYIKYNQIYWVHVQCVFYISGKLKPHSAFGLFFLFIGILTALVFVMKCETRYFSPYSVL